MAKIYRYPRESGQLVDNLGRLFFQGSSPGAATSVLLDGWNADNTPGAGALKPAWIARKYPAGTPNNVPRVTGAIAGGIYVGGWAKIDDPAPGSNTWTRSNVYQFSVRADNWNIVAMCQNPNVTTTALNTQNNISLGASKDAGATYQFINDQMYVSFDAWSEMNGFQVGGGQTRVLYPGSGSTVVNYEVTSEDLKGWIYYGVLVVPSETGFVFDSWTIFQRIPYVWHYTDSVPIATLRSDVVTNGGWTAGQAAAWTPAMTSASIYVARDTENESDVSYINFHTFQETSPASDSAILARAINTSPDSSAWGQWSLKDVSGAPVLTDFSGHSRPMTLPGTSTPGQASPFTDPTTSTNSSSIIGSGGGVFGGSATRTAKRVQTGTGGAIAGGAATLTKKAGHVGAGGAVAGGAATLSNKHVSSIVGSGGGVFGGTAVRTAKAVIVGTSGGILGGTTTRTSKRVQTGTGGAVAGGVATLTKKAGHIGAGGAVFGGSASILNSSSGQVSSIVGSGGGVFGGTAAQTRKCAKTGVGGAIVGAATVLSKKAGHTSTGGAVLAGAAIQTRKAVIIGTSGGVLAGTATKSAKRVQSGTGGGVLGGTSPSLRLVTKRGSGGAVAGGAGTLTKRAGIVATGGGVMGGTSLIVVRCHIVGTGGAVAGGTWLAVSGVEAWMLVGGAWVQVESIWQIVGGEWREVDTLSMISGGQWKEAA